MLKTLQKIFGTEKKKSYNYDYPYFYPLNYSSSAHFNQINNKFKLLYYYLAVPDLKGVIDYSAKALTRGIIRLYKLDNKGEIIEEITAHPFLDLLKQPNPFESGSEFFTKLYQQWKIFGNAYILPTAPVGFENKPENVKQLWTLPPQFINPKINTNPLFKDESNIIFQFSFDSNATDIPLKSLIHIKESKLDFVNNYIEGESFISSLKFPLNNVETAFEAQNVLLNKRGALGILTNASKDSDGVIPLRKSQIKQIQQDFQNYGIHASQHQIIISNAALEWQQISLPAKDLMLFETIENNGVAICNAFNFPINLLNYNIASTYNNVNEAKKELYVNKIIPESQILTGSLSRFFNLRKNNLKLEIDYSQIEALQPDKKAEAEKDALTVQTILNIQNSVKLGNTSADSAINIMTQILDFSEKNAKLILGL